MRKTAKVMLIVILCYLIFGVFLSMNDKERIQGSVEDQMYAITEQIQICHSEMGVQQVGIEKNLLLLCISIFAPIVLMMQFLISYRKDNPSGLIHGDTLVSNKVQLND